MSRFKKANKQPRFRYSALAHCVAWANISIQVLFPLAVTFTPTMTARAALPRLSTENTAVATDNNAEKNIASFAANAGKFLSSQPDSDATRNFVILLEALFDPWLTSVQASVLLQQRPAEGWNDVDQFLSNPILTRVDEYTKRKVKDVLVVQSNYFWLRSDITVNETELTMNSLISRQGPQYFSVQRHHTGDSE
ncbi:TPA: general secretion pathway protein GspK [Escherichia coli]|nr:general secretion pathway protein GspK [Escherichia coli]